MTISTLHISGAGPSTQQHRQLLSALIGSEGTVGDSMAVSQRSAGANLSVDVATGHAVVTGDTTTWQGRYLVTSDAVTNKVIPAADPSNPRIDRIVLKVRESAVDGGANDSSVFEVVEGTPAASPSAPSLPVSALPLAKVAVAAGATSIQTADITDDRPRATITPSLVMQANAESLTDDTSGVDAFSQWGAQEVNFAASVAQGRPVRVVALLTGAATYDQASAARRRVRTRIDVSWNGGSTWTQSPESPPVEVHGNDLRSVTLAQQAVFEGTPTKSVKLRAMIEQDTLGTSGDITFQDGILSAQLIPT